MGDDGTMDSADFDILADVAHELFGDAVDPRELSDIISKMNDASEVHVPTGAAQKSHRKKMMVNAVGQGLNALAIGAGTHALIMAGSDDRLNAAGKADKAAGKKTFARLVSKPYRAYETTEVHRKMMKHFGREGGKNAKYAIPAAGAALGLHSAELVGDSIAARALGEQRKQSSATLSSVASNRSDAKTKALVKKSLSEIVNARRLGAISTERAIEMSIEVLSKAQEASKIESEAKKIVPEVAHKTLKPKGIKGPKLTKEKGSALPAPPNGVPAVQSDVSKSEPILTWTGEISKMDTDKRQVFGFCSVTHINGEPVIDLQGDYTPLEEIEKAAYTYVLESRKGGDMHQRNGAEPLHTSDLVESFVVTPEKLETMGLDRNAIPHGWWVGFKVNDDKQWDMVKSGERAGFSIHGSGRRIEKMLGA